MAYVTDKKEVLRLLVENLRSAHPGIVDSKSLADKLGMDARELCRLVKMMRESGEVESDQDGQRLLITRQGLDWMTQHGERTAAVM